MTWRDRDGEWYLVQRCDDAHGPTVPGRQRWPDDVKARIVSESFEPGVTVQEVTRRHGLLCAIPA